MSNRYAVVDIGSLKVKFIVAEATDNNIDIIKKDSKLTLIGKGLKEEGHQILEESSLKTIKAVKQFQKQAKILNVKAIKIVATEGLRKAKNIKEFLQVFEKEVGQSLEIISQEQEAKTLFNAVIQDFPEDQDIALVDMGGGSVQVIIGNKNGIKSIHFLPLGVYFTQQKFVSKLHDGLDSYPSEEELLKLTTYIQNTINDSDMPNGTGTPLVYGSSVILELFKFLRFDLKESSLSLKHPYHTSPSELKKFLEVIKNKTHREREEMYPFQYGYMWGVQMAFTNAITIAKHLGTNIIIPSNVNIAEGYIYELVSELKG
jgi:exopolyphosphatase/pppGpp-phosphohydrolase